jgi:serine/threonine-protein kinase
VAEAFGDYDVREQIGSGGIASVHLATSRVDGRQVALKRLLQHHAEDPDQMRAFTDKARLIRQLHHPNIATTYDCGNVGTTYFIAMEYVPGHTLQQLIHRCDEISATRPLHGLIPFPITIAILIQLCDALEYAHTLRDAAGKPLGIIHRDVSPANVILSTNGVVKLIDFGIAKATSQTVHSNVGTVKGKYSYMAPEYLKGTLDFRVDLWALGVVAHELLTNKRLFKGVNDFETIFKVRGDTLEPPSKQNADVPPELDAIVMKALQRDPAARWQSAGAIRAALAKAASDLHIVVTAKQMIEWIDWTFTQAPLDKRSEVSQLIKLLETPRSTISKVLPLDPSMIVSMEPSLPVPKAPMATPAARGAAPRAASPPPRAAPGAAPRTQSAAGPAAVGPTDVAALRRARSAPDLAASVPEESARAAAARPAFAPGEGPASVRPASAQEPARPASAPEPPPPSTDRLVSVEPARPGLAPARRDPSRPTPAFKRPIAPEAPATGVLRVLLLVVLLAAVGGFVAWYLGYLPDVLVEQLGLPRR